MYEPKCTFCGSPSLEQGYMPEVHQGGAHVATWFPGLPEPSSWTGLKLKGKQKRAVEVWRCQTCSHLEMFAGPLE